MKLSLWQQFSSNHSSGFTVIGEFPTHEDAVRAAAEIQRIFDRLEAWHSEHEAEMDRWWNGGSDSPAPIEEQLAREYSINWKRGVTWFNNATVEIVMDRLVFLTPSQRPDTDGHPFDQIMTSLGGKGYHDGNLTGQPSAIILFDVTCRAPDTETARKLQETYDMFTQRVERKGRTLHFARWRYRERSTDLQDLIQVLADNNCTHIEYHFTQIDPFDETSELYTAEDVPYIIRALTGKDEDDYDEANDALGQIRDPRAVESLIKALSVPDDWIRDEVIKALVGLDTPTLTEALLPHLRKKALRTPILKALKLIGEPAKTTLEKTLEAATDPALKKALQMTLGEITSAPLSLVDALRSQDYSIREAAFKRVIKTDNREVMLDYMKVVPQDEFRMRDIMVYLARKGETRLIPILVERITSFKDIEFIGLQVLGAPAVPILLNMAHNHPQEMIRVRAIDTLGWMADPQTFDFFMDLLSHPSLYPRSIHSAIYALGKIGNPGAIPALLDTFVRELEVTEPTLTHEALITTFKELEALDLLLDPLLDQLQQVTALHTEWKWSFPDQPSHKLYLIINFLGKVPNKRAVEPLLQLLPQTDEQFQWLIKETLRKSGYHISERNEGP